MKNTVNDLWKIVLMFINPLRNYGRFKEDNPYYKPFAATAAISQTLKSIIGILVLSPLKFVVWIIETR